MTYYKHVDTNEIKQIPDEVYNAWVTAQSPKASAYQPIPDPSTPYDRWNGTVWVSPPKYIPQSVTRFQALAQLHNAGLLSQVQTIMNDPNVDFMTKLAWDNAQSFERNSPTINSLAKTLNLTDAQVDDLFIAAEKIAA